MEWVRLKIDQIRVRAPLPFDVFDEEGRMLLCQGFVIETEQQLERLIERGLYSDAAVARESRSQRRETPLPDVAPRRQTRRVSVFALVGEAARRLEALLDAPQGATAFPAGVLEAARGLQAACAVDSDAALANILLVRPSRCALRQMVNVAVLTDILLKQVGWGEGERLPAVVGALTMNVAMLELQEILYRHSAPLTEDQKRQIADHTRDGVAWLRSRGAADAAWLEIVAQHHEAIDGSGYPARLKSGDIRLEAQVVSLADAYCGMVSERAYRPGVLPNAALREIFMRRGAAIDAALAGILIKEMGIYPPGTVVALANGDIGVVIKRTLDANHPVVRSLRAANGKAYPDAPKRQTSKQQYAIAGVRAAENLGLEIDCDKLWAPSLVDTEERGPADE